MLLSARADPNIKEVSKADRDANFSVFWSQNRIPMFEIRVRDSESIDGLYFAMSTHFALHQFKSSECALH